MPAFSINIMYLNIDWMVGLFHSKQHPCCKYPNDKTHYVCSSNGDWRTDAFFGAGEGRIWLDDFNCDGHEEWIEECNSVYWGINNCSHNEDAGVSCCEYDYVMLSDKII